MIFRDSLEWTKEHLVGHWRAELTGYDLLALALLDESLELDLTLNRNGTAIHDLRVPGAEDRSAILKEAPFPVTWDIAADRVLSIHEPVPPMPEYELPDWSRNATRYGVLAVSTFSLGLKLRGFESDGPIIVLRRMDPEEFHKRQGQLYVQTLQAIKEVYGVTPADPRLRRLLDDGA